MKNIVFDLYDDGRVKLTAFIHEQSDEMPMWKNRPAVVVCPGGGYGMLSERESEPVALSFLAQGYHAFVLRYSVGKNAAWPNPVVDLSRALMLIRQNAEEWGLIPEKIAVCGFSAGGHLAACIGTLWDNPEVIEASGAYSGENRPNALILNYPCILYDIKWYENIYKLLAGNRPHSEMKNLLSCDKNVGEHTPPAFIFHTFSDNCVPVEHAMAFANAMVKADRPVEIHIFKDGVHGMALGTEISSWGYDSMVNKNASAWFPLAINWLNDLFETPVSDIVVSKIFGSPEGRAHLQQPPPDWDAAIQEADRLYKIKKKRERST